MDKNIDEELHEVSQHSENENIFWLCDRSSDFFQANLTGGPGVICRSVRSPVGHKASVNELTDPGAT